MAYSIKHVHLLENSPFKKISTYNKTMNDNDGEWIDRMQKRIDTYRIDSVKARLIENFLYNFSEQLDRSKLNFIKTFKDQNTVLDYLDSDMISFYLGNSNNEENDNLENLEIKLSSNKIKIIVPCRVNNFNHMLVFEHGYTQITPFSVFIGLLEYVFNDPQNKYVDVLRDYSLKEEIHVEFKIMNMDDWEIPHLLFIGYDDNSYVDDFKCGYLDMFTNNLYKSPYKQQVFHQIYFINCFNNTKDLAELKYVKDISFNTCVTEANIFYCDNIYDEKTYRFLFKTFIGSFNMIGSDLDIKGTSHKSCKPNMDCINVEAINSGLPFKINLSIIPSSNGENLPKNGFKNDLIKWADKYIIDVDEHNREFYMCQRNMCINYIKLYLNCTHNYRYHDIYVYYTHLDFY